MTEKGVKMSTDGVRKSQSKRASRACLACRQRRVRCNVVEESPCSNCRFRSVQCVVKRRGSEQVWSEGSKGSDDGRKAASPSPKPCPNVPAPSKPQFRLGGVETYAKELDLTSVLHGGLSDDILKMIQEGPAGGSSSAASASLPAFIRPLPSRMSADDAQYLRDKGALNLPSQSLRSSLLHSFVEFVYPYLPIIDLGALIDTTFQLKDGQISLLLFQAVMFAGTAFVDLGLLQQAGFSSRKEARRVLFHRTRLLYDFDYERDNLVLLQALLLMTYWHNGVDDEKDLTHWIGIAVALARTMDLHWQPDPPKTPEQLLHKRVWWSCFIRDRQIALGLRRPPKILEASFNVPMLEESDFDIDISTSSIMIMQDEGSSLLDSQMRRDFATMCIFMAKLCLHIGHILETVYIVRFRSTTAPGQNGVLLYPNHNTTPEMVETLDQELESWVKSLPACCLEDIPVQQEIKRGRSNVAVQRALLLMIYYTTVSTLHRPQCQLPSSSSTGDSGIREKSRLKVLNAAIHVADLATELHNMSLKRFLPPAGITAILPATIVHLIEMKNPAPGARALAEKYFRQCMTVIVDLQETYNAADDAMAILRAALGETPANVQPAVNNNSSPDTTANQGAFTAGSSDVSSAQSYESPMSDFGASEMPPLLGEPALDDTPGMQDFELYDQFIDDAMHVILQENDATPGTGGSPRSEEVNLDELF